jgi:hypothetical protein
LAGRAKSEGAAARAKCLNAVSLRDLKTADQERADAGAAPKIKHKVDEVCRLQVGDTPAGGYRAEKRGGGTIAPFDIPFGIDDEQRVGQRVENCLGILELNCFRG